MGAVGKGQMQQIKELSEEEGTEQKFSRRYTECERTVHPCCLRRSPGCRLSYLRNNNKHSRCHQPLKQLAQGRLTAQLTAQLTARSSASSRDRVDNNFQETNCILPGGVPLPVANMGRKPNALILEFFERGAKLADQSNRYEHSCKRCGQVVSEQPVLYHVPLLIKAVP